MGNIKNLKRISDLLSQEDLATLEAAAAEHFQEYGIEYKILEVDERSFKVLITQAAPPTEKFFSNKELSGISKELFRRFLPNMGVHSRPLAFYPPKANIVNAGWVNSMLAAKGITFDAIQEETGLDRKKLHDWLSGKEPMSPEVKAMFYYMLR